MHQSVYVVGLVGVVVAFVFRAQLSGAIRFVSSTMHAFASEYNDVYTNNEQKEE